MIFQVELFKNFHFFYTDSKKKTGADHSVPGCNDNFAGASLPVKSRVRGGMVLRVPCRFSELFIFGVLELFEDRYNVAAVDRPFTAGINDPGIDN